MISAAPVVKPSHAVLYSVDQLRRITEDTPAVDLHRKPCMRSLTNRFASKSYKITGCI